MTGLIWEVISWDTEIQPKELKITGNYKGLRMELPTPTWASWVAYST